jgi:DNA mismatch repair protein MutS
LPVASPKPATPKGWSVTPKACRIVTPGTVVDGSLNATTNNYIVALLVEQHQVGSAYADLSTGEFACCELHGPLAHQHALGELACLQAAEVLVSDNPSQRIAGIDAANRGFE